MAIKINDIVTFQPYKGHEPVDGKVVRKGTLKELGRLCLDDSDTRIFYEVETLDTRNPWIFTVTTKRFIKLKKDLVD